jgi:hypothetical protein
MSKKGLVFVALGACVFNLCVFHTVSAQTNFSGNWVLNKDKTRNLPPRLEGYTMVVEQSENQLTVQSKVEGDLRPPEREPNGEFPGGGGIPGSPGDSGFPGGPGGGFPGGPGSGGFPGGRGGGKLPGGAPPSGLMAFAMVIPSATYSLDGQQSTAEVERPRPGKATLTAKWAKDRKVLELSAVRHLEFQGKDVSFTSKERWSLSEDGEVLTLQRAVETPRGKDTVKLTFLKEREHQIENKVQ